MFKKPLAHQSNATPLRSSARRQLLTAIYEQFPSFKDDVVSGDVSSGGNEDGGLSEKELGKLILPEGLRSCTFETSAGVEGTFYISPEGEVLWMTFGRSSKEFIPTLSLLSLLPVHLQPLPTIQLHHPLPPPLLTGAPLFIPPVRNLSSPHLIPDIEQGGLVAFVSSTRNHPEDVSYVGVGRVIADGGVRGAVERRMEVLKTGEERDEGRFAEILCIVGDHLWEMGSKAKLPTFPLPIPTKGLAPPPASLASQANQGGPDEGASAGPSISFSHSLSQSLPPMEDLSLTPRSESESDSAPLSATEISTLLSISLLQSLTLFPQTSLPIPASLLYSAHVLPNRPAYIPKDRREDVVIGKSEWKKLSKWMKEVHKEGLLKIKETKGEVVVTGFDPRHPSLMNHETFLTITEEEVKMAKKAARAAATDEGPAVGGAAAPGGANGGGAKGKGKGKEMVIEELWKPSGPSASFWEACGVNKSSFHQPPAMRSALDGYITKHKLLAGDHRNVLLDEELGRAVGIKKPEAGSTLSREEVLRRLRSGVAWSVSVGGTIKKGTLSPITLTVKTRQGRKTVTHITGLEGFNVDIDGFAEELRKVCAGSASVQPLPGASPKLGLQEIMVQGNQVRVITESLVGKGVPKRYIKEGQDSKKKK